MKTSPFIFPLIAFTLFVSFVQAQVGIGTTSPSAELEILGSNTGVPTLELNPQLAPVGTATGQLAVIGDLLYMYDATRIKWLSVESTALQYGKKKFQKTSDWFLKFGGDVKENSPSEGIGPIMPFDGTIVCVSVISSSGGSETLILSLNGATSGTSIPLSSGVYSSTSLNVNFSAGNYITIYTPTASKTAKNLGVVVWVKWRQ